MISVLNEINRMQDIMGSPRCYSVNHNWEVFYEEDDNGHAKGLVILFFYSRLPYKTDYITGKVAEIQIFTFPEYRRQGVCTRLVKQAIEYAKKNKVDIVADTVPAGYAALKKLGFIDSKENRVWLQCSNSQED